MRDDDGIAPFPPRRTPPTRPAHAGATVLEQAEAHWRGLAKGGALPRRRDLDAGALGPALPQSFTLEEVAPGIARIRMAGQRLHDWFGADPRGVPLTALFQDASRPSLREALLALFGRPALVELDVATPRGALRAPVAGRLLLLPMQSDDGRVTRAVGVMGVDSALPAGSRRFAIAPDHPVRIEPAGQPAPARRMAGHYALPERAAAAPALAERGRPWLRLVVSND